MQIIPALDLKDAGVVHALGGDRRLYRPLTNARFPSAAPCDVVRRLSAQYGCETFYIADLNAIGGDGDNTTQIRELIHEFPKLEWWLDAGIRNHADFMHLHSAHPTAHLIVASETLRDTQLPATLTAAAAPFILSLDFDGDSLRGASHLLERMTHWPQTLVTLSLSAVGTAAGPDLATVATLRKRCGRRRLVAGGGVRNRHDLVRLGQAGADAALIANALYTGTIV